MDDLGAPVLVVRGQWHQVDRLAEDERFADEVEAGIGEDCLGSRHVDDECFAVEGTDLYLSLGVLTQVLDLVGVRVDTQRTLGNVLTEDLGQGTDGLLRSVVEVAREVGRSDGLGGDRRGADQVGNDGSDELQCAVVGLQGDVGADEGPVGAGREVAQSLLVGGAGVSADGRQVEVPVFALLVDGDQRFAEVVGEAWGVGLVVGDEHVRDTGAPDNLAQPQVLGDARGRLPDVCSYGVAAMYAVTAGNEGRHPPVPCEEAEVPEVFDPGGAVGDDPHLVPTVAEVLGNHALSDGVPHTDAVDADDHVERLYVL